jgi:hypothetical protein
VWKRSAQLGEGETLGKQNMVARYSQNTGRKSCGEWPITFSLLDTLFNESRVGECGDLGERFFWGESGGCKAGTTPTTIAFRLPSAGRTVYYG